MPIEIINTQSTLPTSPTTSFLRSLKLGAIFALSKIFGIEAIWRGETSDRNGEKPRQIRIGLGHRHSGLQTRKCALAETSELGLRTVPLERQDKCRIFSIQKMKSLRQNSDNLARLSIHGDRTPDDRALPPNFFCQ